MQCLEIKTFESVYLFCHHNIPLKKYISYRYGSYIRLCFHQHQTLLLFLQSKNFRAIGADELGKMFLEETGRTIVANVPSQSKDFNVS